MLEAAVKAAKGASSAIKRKSPLLIGVTVLTSQESGRDEILRLARIGLGCGLDGVVCSVQEVRLLRGELGKDFVIVTPGIRPKQTGVDDQKRIATASQAIALPEAIFWWWAGPILEAKNPVEALTDILNE